MRVFDRAERATHWHLAAGGLVIGWNAPRVYAMPSKRPFSHEIWPLPSDTCISPGRECQRMSAGLFHMWLAFLSCSPSLLLSFSPTAPTTCPSLEAPAHGTKFGSKFFVGHEVHFVCSQGFQLIGSTTRVCRDNGTWSGVNAACKGEHHSGACWSVLWFGVTLETHIHLTQD